jgi:hypothetical protein
VKIFLFITLAGLSTVLALLTVEISLRLLAEHSYKIKQLTYSPYRRTDFEKIVDFVRLLENQLNSDQEIAKQNTIQTINLGIPCTATAIYRKQLEVVGQKYDPDLIVMGFFVGNDFVEDDWNRRIIRKDVSVEVPSLIAKHPEIRTFSFVYNLMNTLRFVNKTNALLTFPNDKERMYGTWLEHNSPLENYDPFSPRMPKQKYIELERERIEILKKESTAYNNLDFITEQIVETKKLAEEGHAKLIVFIIPDEMQFNQELLNEVTQSAQISYDDIEIEKPQKVIHGILEKNNIPYIDLYASFRSDSNPQKYYQPQDSHFNSLGNQKTADILFTEMKPIILNEALQ